MRRCDWFGRFFFAQITEFLERFKDLNTAEIDKDEEAAGVHRVQRFGVFATMDTLTGGDLTKHESYWKLPAEVVYTKLLYDKAVRDFQKDLTKIKEVQNGAKHK